MKKNKLFNVAALGVVMLASTLTYAQQGQTECYGAVARDYVVGTKKGSSELVDPSRRDYTKAQGAPQNDNTENFVSLGYGGSIIIDFSGAVLDLPGNDITIIETSYASNDCNSDGIERANVEVSQDGVNFVSVGQVCRNGSVDIADSGLPYVISVRISNDASSTTFDGYDVDGVIANAGCVEIPTRTGCFAIDVYDYEQGTLSNGGPITDPIRIDPTKALGVPQDDRSSGADNFFTLGKDGWIILRMGGNILTDGTAAPDLRVFETTWGNPSCANYPEYAEISVSPDAITWYPLGTVCQSSNISLDLDNAGLPSGLPMSFVKIENNFILGGTPDYFDVDGVEALWGCGNDDTPPTRGACTATCVLNYVEGTKKNGNPISDLRDEPNNALGYPQYDDTINFVTLGYGGSIDLCFGNEVVMNEPGDDFQIVETSFGNPTCSNYKEYADVYVSLDALVWYPVATGVCLDASIDISNAPVALPYVRYIRIVNNDALSTTEDGYDVDGVIVLNGDCQPAIVRNNPSTTIVGSLQANVAGLISSPNPAKTDLNFSFNVVETSEATLELFNMNGQLVAKVFSGQAFDNQENIVKFDASQLANGVYISRLTTQDGIITGKVLIAH